MSLPPELDLAIYRRYPDLARMSDEEARRHFDHYGRSEGRVATSIGSRLDFLPLIDQNSAALEIAPFYSPQLKGPGVHYFDVLDRRQLQERAMRIGADGSLIPSIDYVSPTGDLSIVDPKIPHRF